VEHPPTYTQIVLTVKEDQSPLVLYVGAQLTNRQCPLTVVTSLLHPVEQDVLSWNQVQPKWKPHSLHQLSCNLPDDTIHCCITSSPNSMSWTTSISESTTCSQGSDCPTWHTRLVCTHVVKWAMVVCLYMLISTTILYSYYHTYASLGQHVYRTLQCQILRIDQAWCTILSVNHMKSIE